MQLDGVSVLAKCLLILSVSGCMAFLHGLIIGGADLATPSDGYGRTLAEIADLENAIWVDTRREGAFAAGHYPDAVHLSEDDWDAGLSRILSVWDFEQPLIVYCDGGDCTSSMEYAERLRREMDTDAVFWLQGGWQVLQEIEP